MKGAVYHGSRLMPGSESFRLLQEGKWKELQAHEKRLADEADRRGDVPKQQEEN